MKSAAVIRPLRVLFIDHTAKLAGGEIALANLLGALDRTRIAPQCLLFEDGPLVGRLEGLDVPVEVMPMSSSVGGSRKDGLGVGSVMRLGGATAGFVRQLARRLRRADVGLVYCNSLKSDLIGGLAAKLAGLPCVWHVHDRIEPDYLPGKVVIAFRLAARVLPAGIVTNSRCTCATLHLPPGKPVTVAYPGVVLPAEVAPEPEGPSTVTIVGRLAPWKGQHVFLEAAARVRREMPDVRFRIVGSALFGEDVYEQKLRARSALPDLSGAVEFRGFQEDVGAEFAASTVVVHASTLPEPFGQTVVEALAAGRAVIAADAGGPCEVVQDQHSGLLVPSGQSDKLEAAMLRLLRDRALRQFLAANGRARVAEAFTIGQTAQDVEQFIETLFAERVRKNVT